MIRPARREDIPGIVRLQETIEAEACVHGYVADTAETWAGHDLDRTYVVVEGEITVGVVHAVPRAYEGECVFAPDDRILEIRELLVAPSHRDRGLGRELIAAIQGVARRDGFSHLRVYSAAKRFDDVRSFYGSCGFEPWYLEMTQVLGPIDPEQAVTERPVF